MWAFFLILNKERFSRVLLIYSIDSVFSLKFVNCSRFFVGFWFYIYSFCWKTLCLISSWTTIHAHRHNIAHSSKSFLYYYCEIHFQYMTSQTNQRFQSIHRQSISTGICFSNAFDGKRHHFSLYIVNTYIEIKKQNR